MRKMKACQVLLAFSIGCGGAESDRLDSAAGASGDVCGAPEDTVVLIITSLHFTRETSPTESEGFDLDGVASTTSDAQGCGHADYTSADGTQGIDNAFAALVPVLESIGAGAVESLINDAINLGELLVLAEIQRVDDVQNDECVDLEMHRGVGAPLMGTDGQIQMDQTFLIDTERPSTFATGGRIRDGIFDIQGVTISLPVQILDEFIEFDLEGSALQLAWQEDGSMAGRLAGGVSTDALGGQIGAIGDIGSLQDVVPPLLEQAADLWPDETGRCTHISVGMEVTARPAFLLYPAD
jgi:hypothetical protein